MCLTSKRLPSESKKDVICYKVFLIDGETLCSPYFHYIFRKKNEILKSKTFTPRENGKYHYGTGFFHAYRWKYFANERAAVIRKRLGKNVVVLKCRIPKGSTIVKNFKEITSTKLEILV